MCNLRTPVGRTLTGTFPTYQFSFECHIYLESEEEVRGITDSSAEGFKHLNSAFKEHSDMMMGPTYAANDPTTVLACGHKDGNDSTHCGHMNALQKHPVSVQQFRDLRELKNHGQL